MEADGSWTDLVLEDLAAPIRNALVGGPFGSDLLSSDYTLFGVPVIRGENLASGRWVQGPFVFVSPAKVVKLAANTAGPLDVVFTQRGANHYRQVGLVPRDASSRFLISQSQMKLTVDAAKADPLFVYYLFRAPEQQEFLRRNAIQTGVPHTNLSILKRVPLRLPLLPQQRAIAHILGTLDDKIELNRRTNETLEAMARALFKSWFVDFDPVHAKAAGRTPAGMDAETAALFPSEFVESEIGEIPKGWRAGTIADVGDHVRYTVDPAQVPQDLPYIGLEHMPQRNIALGAWSHASAAESQKTRFALGDILFGKLRPYFHKVGIAATDGVCSTDIVVVRSRASCLGIALGHLSSDAFVAFTTAGSDGTRMPRTSWARMANYQIPVPTAAASAALDRHVGPLLARIHASLFESRELAATRDTILPRLLSGELRIPDAERIVGDAT